MCQALPSSSIPTFLEWLFGALLTSTGFVTETYLNLFMCRHRGSYHSPRWYEGRLWLLESGTGYIGWVNLENRRFEPVVFCPGYLRGLAFYGDYAFIGASLPREASGFNGLVLDENLAERGLSPRCGVFVVDWRRGEILHDIEVTGGVQELYDVAILPNTQRPRAVSLTSEDICFLLSIGENLKL